MSMQAADDRVVETLIAASIIGRQNSAADFTAEQIEQYFTNSQTPDPEIDAIISKLPPQFSDLLDGRHTASVAGKRKMVQLAAVTAMNRQNASDEHSETNRAALDQARREALERLKGEQ